MASDVTCRKLRKFEKTLKNDYYNAASYKKKVLFADLSVLKKARN